jgi:drug/metabolite transporter (DMT)-like permease
MRKPAPALIFRLMPMLLVLVWGFGAIFIKLGLQYADPFVFLWLRLLIATLVMFTLSLWLKAPWPTSKAMLKKIIYAGLFLQCFYLVTFIYTIYYKISPAIITIILGLQPILTAVIYGQMQKKSVSLSQWLGTVLGLIGIVFVVVKDLSFCSASRMGLFFAFACLVSNTWGSLLQKKNSDMNLLTGTTLQLAAGLIPVSLLTAFFSTFTIPLVPMFLVSLAWVSLIVSVGATCLYYTLLKHGHIVATTNLFYLVPVVTTTLCYFIFDETFSSMTLIGLAFIIAGIILVHRKKTIEPIPQVVD